MQIGGPALGLETHKALCLLPLNAYNEVFFLAIWFWLIILATATLMNIGLIIVTSCGCPGYLIKTGMSSKAKKCIKNILDEAHDIGAFYHLYLVKLNCDDLTFHEFVCQIGKDS